jgi:hypothetical protein
MSHNWGILRNWGGPHGGHDTDSRHPRPPWADPGVGRPAMCRLQQLADVVALSFTM